MHRFTSTKPRRFRYRFGLRSLFLLVTVAAIPLTWLAWQISIVHNRRQVVSEIEELGGSVRFVEQATPSNPQPFWRNWARALLGDDFFAEVEQVQSFDAVATDETLARIATLPRLDQLLLQSNLITDHGLHHLRRLRRLKTLQVESSAITAAGIGQLKELDLNALQLRGENVDDSWIAEITKLTNLKFLNVDGTKITSEGLKKLRQALPSCRVPSPPTDLEQMPQEFQISRKEESAIWFHRGKLIHFVLYHRGYLQTGLSSSAFEHSGHLGWRVAGGIHILNTREFSILFESKRPEILFLDGTPFDLRRGRIFVLEVKGPPRQLPYTPPEPDENIVTALGRRIESAMAIPESKDVATIGPLPGISQDVNEAHRIQERSQQLAKARRDAAVRNSPMAGTWAGHAGGNKVRLELYPSKDPQAYDADLTVTLKYLQAGTPSRATVGYTLKCVPGARPDNLELRMDSMHAVGDKKGQHEHVVLATVQSIRGGALVIDINANREYPAVHDVVLHRVPEKP